MNNLKEKWRRNKKERVVKPSKEKLTIKRMILQDQDVAR